MENTIQNNFCSNNNSKKKKTLCSSEQNLSMQKPLSQTSGIPVQVSWWERRHWNLPFSQKPTLVFPCQDESFNAPSSYTSSCYSYKSRFRRWYSDALRARRFVVPNPVEVRFTVSVRSDPGVQPSSSTMDIPGFCHGRSSSGAECWLPPPQIAPSLRINGCIPLLLSILTFTRISSGRSLGNFQQIDEIWEENKFQILTYKQHQCVIHRVQLVICGSKGPDD